MVGLVPKVSHKEVECINVSVVLIMSIGEPLLKMQVPNMLSK